MDDQALAIETEGGTALGFAVGYVRPFFWINFCGSIPLLPLMPQLRFQEF